jgi:hypothetical protein
VRASHFITVVVFAIFVAAFVCGVKIGDSWKDGVACTVLAFMAIAVGVIMGQMYAYNHLREAKRAQEKIRNRDKEFEQTVLGIVRRERLAARKLVLELVSVVARRVARRAVVEAREGQVDPIVKWPFCGKPWRARRSRTRPVRNNSLIFAPRVENWAVLPG